MPRPLKQEPPREPVAAHAIPSPEAHTAQVISGAISWHVETRGKGRARFDEQSPVQAAARACVAESEGLRPLVYAVDATGAVVLVPRPLWQQLAAEASRRMSDGAEAIDCLMLAFDVSRVADLGRAK